MIATASPPQHSTNCTCGTLDLTCCHGGATNVIVVFGYGRYIDVIGSGGPTGPVYDPDAAAYYGRRGLPDVLDYDGPTDWSGVPWHLWPAVRRQA